MTVRVVVIGSGGMARDGHMRRMLQQTDTTHITHLCELSPTAYETTAALFEEMGQTPPPNEPDLAKLLADHAGELDAALIATPHSFHYEQAAACMEAGLDVLLEKPMVTTADEAERLIEIRDRTGRLLVVAFNGSMSPHVRTGVKMLRSGELGDILTISATVWQDWKNLTTGTWRQQPEISAGGFLFDTGAHMLNTVVDLAGEGFTEVGAWLDPRGTDVDILGVVMGRLKSGALVTMHGCGDTRRGGSDLRVFCTRGNLYTSVWGGKMEVQRPDDDELKPVDVPPSLGTWRQFLLVRSGDLPNPCPPEVGLRMARLWDAIKESSARSGVPVQVG